MRLLVPLAFSAVLAGCGSDPEPHDSAVEPSPPSFTPTASVEPWTPPETPSDTAAATKPDKGVTVQWRCEGRRYSTMEDAWVGRHPNCIDTKAWDVPSKREAAAVRLAYGADTKVTPRLVGILYGICGSNNSLWPFVVKNDVMGAAEAQETKGAVLLCPDHDNVDRVGPAVAAALKQAERDRNRIQYDGTYLVGMELSPGTYVATPNGACYWERTDRNGEIIDNNFSNGARMQFTVEPTDYSVSVQGCGEWKRAG